MYVIYTPNTELAMCAGVATNKESNAKSNCNIAGKDSLRGRLLLLWCCLNLEANRKTCIVCMEHWPLPQWSSSWSWPECKGTAIIDTLLTFLRKCIQLDDSRLVGNPNSTGYFRYLQPDGLVEAIQLDQDHIFRYDDEGDQHTGATLHKCM